MVVVANLLMTRFYWPARADHAKALLADALKAKCVDPRTRD